MNVKRGVKGAVSIFIVLILVPCIVSSSLFVDVGRVHLGKGVATSAADLALNSLMSNYDEVLTDYYGFIASCQNIEEFYDETAEYFLMALKSQGLSDDDIDSIFAAYQKYLGDTDNISDLIQLNCVSEDLTKIVGEANGASVGGSSAIIKDQVVEFMKFRGPINIVMNVVDRLKANNADVIAGQSKENEAVTDSKQEFANDEEALLDALFKTYTYIIKYQDQKINNVRLERLMNKMIEYRKLYLEMTEKIISNFHNTSSLSVFSRPQYGLGYVKQAYTVSDVYSYKETSEDGVTTYYVDGDDVKAAFDSVSAAISAFDNAKTGVVNAVGTTLINQKVGTGDSDANPIQWWAQVNSKISSPLGTFRTEAKDMLDAYNKMKVMYETCEYDDSFPDYDSDETADPFFAINYSSTYEDLKDMVEDRQALYLKSGKQSSTDNYLILVNKLESVSANNINQISPDKVTLSNGKTIGATALEISNFLNAESTALNEAIKALDVAINGKWLSPHVKSLDGVAELVDNYNSSFKTWSGNVKALTDGNPLKESEQAEVDRYNSNKADNGENDGQPRQIKIEKKDIEELKKRLTNIKNQCQTAKDKIDELKYCSKKLRNLTTYSNVYDAVKGKIGSAPLTNSAIITMAHSIFKDNFTPYSGDLNQAMLTLSNFKEEDYNPDLTVKKPKLFDWMETKFKDEDGSGYDEQKAKADALESSAGDEESSAKETTKEAGISETDITSLTNAADFPSGLDGADAFGALSGLGDLVSVIKHLVKGEFTALRDALYSTEYVMSMFSYATFDEEGKYHLAKEKDNNLKYSERVTAFKAVENDWKKEEKYFTDNKTLTNKMINADNNVAFGAEAEYVLYGKTNQGSVNSAFGSIYAIRYPLNLASGFQHFWSGDNLTAVAINSLANSICSLSSGIIPAAVVKVAAILLLAAVETGADLVRLGDGFPVELYKADDSDWVTSFSGESDSESAEFIDSDGGLFYSDYIYLFLCLGFSGDKASEMYYRVGDLIQANMRKTQGDTYTLSKSRVYFKLNAKLRVDPLMLEIPMVSEYTSEIGVAERMAKDDWCTFELNVVRGYS